MSCFNTSAGSKALLLKAAGIQNIDRSALISLRAADEMRRKSATQKITKYINVGVRTKKLEKEAVASSKEHYHLGGLTSEGERTAPQKPKRSQISKGTKKEKVDLELSWHHHQMKYSACQNDLEHSYIFRNFRLLFLSSGRN